jgi:hypothetical protein
VFATAIAVFCLIVGGGITISLLGRRNDLGRHPAPARCISLWNQDRKADKAGRHNYRVHGYSRVQVLRYLHGGIGAGACTVIFARKALDPESFAAAYTLRAGGWYPLSQFIDERALAVLQDEAVVEHNAVLHSDGTISPD